MKNLKIKPIMNYLKPYKKDLLVGFVALLFVNLLSVLIPLEIRNIVDQVEEGFTSRFIITKSILLIILATFMGYKAIL